MAFERTRAYIMRALATPEMKDFVGNFSSGGGSLNLLSGMRGGADRGARDLLESYSRMPWLRAVAAKISDGVAGTDWVLFRVPGAANDKQLRAHVRKILRTTDPVERKAMIAQVDAEEIDRHPILDILDDGNTLMSGHDVIKVTALHLDLVGEAFWIKDRDDPGRPFQIWPVVPTAVLKLPERGEDFFEIQVGSNVKNIPKGDVIWFKDIDPLNPYGRGVGIAKALGDELDADEAAAIHQRSFLQNNARPDFLVMPTEDGKRMDADVIERLKQSWLALTQGPQRRGVPMFLPKRMEFKEMTQSFEALNLVELRRQSRDFILQGYGMPPEKMGVIENSNRSTIDGSDLIFVKEVIAPRQNLITNVLNRQLVSEFGDDLVLDYRSTVIEDKEHVRAVIEKNGWAFSVDEIRDTVGRAPLGDEGDGDLHLVPVSGFLQTLSDETPEPEPPADDEPPEDEPDDDDEPDDEGEDEPDDAENLMRHLGAAVTRGTDPDDLADAADEGEIRKAIVPNAEETVETAGQQRIDDLGLEIDFDMRDPEVVAFIEEEGAVQVRRVNDTTKAAIRKAVQEGVESGEGIPQIRRRIQGVFETTGKRAGTIARTETIRAANAGNLAATKQSGFDGKQWLSSRDSEVRDSHTNLDGQVQPVDKDFESPTTGATGPHPGNLGAAEEDINCRCTILSVDLEETTSVDGDIVWPKHLDTEEKRVQIWKTMERLRLPLERKMAEDLKKAFRRQEKAVLAELRR